MIQSKIKVLVVDDSLVFREIIARGLNSDPMIEVVAKAGDAYEAWEKILETEPDVVTCDIRMPKMDGIDFVRKVLPKRALPIIMVSVVSEAVFDAMNAGAVDFVSKPDVKTVGDVEQFIYDLRQKVKAASQARLDFGARVSEEPFLEAVGLEKPPEKDRIIAIGASTGGTEAVFSILTNLPAYVPGIVVVQHIPPVFSKLFAERLNRQSRLKVKEAENGDYVEEGNVYIAPGDRHVRVLKTLRGYRLECFQAERVNGHCPSADVLFESVARSASDKAIGVILTGMGYDGAKGLLAMKRKGAKTIGQDEDTSVVFGMPKIAFQMGAVDKQCSLKNIPYHIMNFLK